MNAPLSEHFEAVTPYHSRLYGDTPLSEEETAELSFLLRSFRSSESYRETLAHMRDDLIHEILGSAHLQDWVTGWEYLPRSTQTEILTQICDLQAAVQSAWTNLPFEATKITWEDKGSIVGTTHFEVGNETAIDDKIILNTQNAGLATSFYSALEALVHEQHHQFHNQLARFYNTGRIETDHPLYGDAEYFSALWEKRTFFRVSPFYEDQLDERNAILFGQKVFEGVRNQIRRACLAKSHALDHS
ncbi:MAG: hypothetical protein AB7E85_00750 [Pseudobdellovibrionaceae bacterium]